MRTSRIPKEVRERFGLFAVIESKRVVLPLKGVECDFSVFSGLVEVGLLQIFRQENEKPLDCEYLFPLPSDASVYSCEADINGRIIRAQVRERQEARQLAAEKKAAGFRTALVESERENLFTLTLGNVQPDDLVVIRLQYFQPLRSVADSRSVEIPFCPGVRYIPGNPLLRSNKGKGIADDTDEVPDASRITPVRIDSEHPDAAYIEVRGALDAGFVDTKTISSPSHAIEVRPEQEKLCVTLSNKGEVPDQDFALRWQEKNTTEIASRVWLREQGNETYALLEIRAPNEVPTTRSPVDFYFLVDRSGSMAGEKWSKAVEALQSTMAALGKDDRAMVTLFESRFQDFAEQPLPASQLLEDRQFQALARLGTAGGTEMRPALKHVLETADHYSKAREKNLILITDAQIGNESAILELMQPALDFPVHCFGIDVALNDSLLLALCRQQGGTFCSLNPRDDIQQAVTKLGKTLGKPVLLDLRLPDTWELADAKIPNLYACQIHYLSARTTVAKPLELIARNASSEVVKLGFERQTVTMQAPYLHWCKTRIQRWIAEGNNPAAIDLSTQSNLICRLTAFVAWDESEKVAVATHQLVQPSQVLGHKMLSLGAAARSVGRRSEHMMYETNIQDAAGADQDLPKRSALYREFLLGNEDSIISLGRAGLKDDKRDLELELSNICHTIPGIDWEPLLKAIHDWLSEATDAMRTTRLEALRQLVDQVRVLATLIAAWRNRLENHKNIKTDSFLQPDKRIERATEEIHRTVRTFVENLTPAPK
jgi:Ca-activated chloride channel family protein